MNNKLLISSHIIFLAQFGISALALRARALLLVFETFTRAYLFQIAREKSCEYLYLILLF